MLRLARVCCVVCLLWGGAARAEPEMGPPPTGTGPLLIGYSAVALAAASLATVPLCLAPFFPSEAREGCFGGALSFAGVATAIGVPTTIVGRRQQRDYQAWMRGVSAWPTSRFAGVPLPGGALLRYRLAF